MQEQFNKIGGWFTPADLSKWQPENSQIKGYEEAETELFFADLISEANKANSKCQTKGNT